MQSNWLTAAHIINNSDKRYRVYRLRDVTAPDCESNREYWSDGSGGSEQSANRFKTVMNYEEH